MEKKLFYYTMGSQKQERKKRRTQEPSQASVFKIINRPNLQNLQISTKSHISKEVPEKLFIMEITIIKLHLEFKQTKPL